MKNKFAIALMICLSIFSACAYHNEKQDVDKGKQKQKIHKALFASTDDAFSALSDKESHLQWEASKYLKEHPEEAIDRLKDIIEDQDPSWIIAMSTLTGIGGKSVVQFYCKLLDKNHYELDENGEKKEYGLGSRHGCIRFPHLFGMCIVDQLGELGDKAADPYLQRAWQDGDFGIKSKIPKARYDIGTVTLSDLWKLATNDTNDTEQKNTYFNTILEIAQDKIYDKTDEAFNIFEQLSLSADSGSLARENAHISLIHCYEQRKDYDKAIAHCDWIINNSEHKVSSQMCNLRRQQLLFHQGKLSLDSLFELAKKENELYDWIAGLARLKDTCILDRIIREAPPDSKYVAEAQYWKFEYFESFQLPERAKSQSDFILQNCKNENVLTWIRNRSAKEKEIAKRISRNKTE
jgi:hypothetical protein